MLLFIEGLYYQDISGIAMPMKKEHLYPHCEAMFSCDNCWLKGTQVLLTASKSQASSSQLASIDWTKNYKSFPDKFTSYITEEIKSEKNKNLYN